MKIKLKKPRVETKWAASPKFALPRNILNKTCKGEEGFRAHACHGKQNYPLPWAQGSQSSSDQDITPQPGPFLEKSFSRGILDWFLPFSAFSHWGGYHVITMEGVESVYKILLNTKYYWIQNAMRSKRKEEPKNYTIHTLSGFWGDSRDVHSMNQLWEQSPAWKNLLQVHRQHEPHGRFVLHEPIFMYLEWLVKGQNKFISETIKV